MTKGVECPRCRFVYLGKLSDAEIQHLIRYVASRAYRAARSRPWWERFMMLKEQITRPPLSMAGLYLYAADRTVFSSGVQEVEKRFFELALSSLKEYLADSPVGIDEQNSSFHVVDVLRRLGRFDEALRQMQSFAARSDIQSSQSAAAIEREFDLIELKQTGPHWDGRYALRGEITATVVERGQSSFAFPLHPLARISDQPKIKYPVPMRYSGITGTVEIAVLVEKTGAVTRVKTLKASMSDFIPAAEQFARASTFVPRVIDGNAVGFECIIAVKFSLKDEEP